MLTILKKVVLVGVGLLVLIVAVIGLGASYMDWSDALDLSKTRTTDLPYLSQAQSPTRGKILAIVSSTATMQVPTKNGIKEKKAGFELTEVARA